MRLDAPPENPFKRQFRRKPLNFLKFVERDDDGLPDNFRGKLLRKVKDRRE